MATQNGLDSLSVIAKIVGRYVRDDDYDILTDNGMITKYSVSQFGKHGSTHIYDAGYGIQCFYDVIGSYVVNAQLRDIIGIHIFYECRKMILWL